MMETMTRIAIIGAHGKVGQQLVRQLSERGDVPVGIARRPDQVAELDELGAEGVLLDIENASADDLAAAIEGCDAIVFSAGAGPGSGTARKDTVDYRGSVLAATAAQKAGVQRFVQVSAMSVDTPVAPDADESWSAYVAAKRDADIDLRRSDLDWTIIRPGGLTLDPSTGSIRLGETVPRGSIPRADVAALIVAVIDDPRTIGKQWEAVSGDTAIADAIDALVAS
jgi:uncharacterized protein YbjT (DUF2867 family)